MARVPRMTAAALALLLAGAMPAGAQSALPPPPSPIGWAAGFMQAMADWAAWAVGWAQAEEQAALDDLRGFAARLESDVQALEQLIEDTGFSLEETEIGLGPLPEITLNLAFVERLGDDERAALLARVSEEAGLFGVIERNLVAAMLAAADSNFATGKVAGYRLKGIEVEVDLIPKIVLIVGREEAASAAAQ